MHQNKFKNYIAKDAVDLHAFATSDQEPESTEAEPTITGLPTLIYTPPLDALDPGLDDAFVLCTYKVEETPPNGVRRLDQKIVGTVQNGAAYSESVKNESGAEGARGEMRECDDRG